MKLKSDDLEFELIERNYYIEKRKFPFTRFGVIINSRRIVLARLTIFRAFKASPTYKRSGQFVPQYFNLETYAKIYFIKKYKAMLKSIKIKL